MRTVVPLTLACTKCAKPIDVLVLGEPRYVTDANGASVLRSPESSELLCADCHCPTVSAAVGDRLRREIDIPPTSTLVTTRGYDNFWKTKGFSTAGYAGVIVDA